MVMVMAVTMGMILLVPVLPGQLGCFGMPGHHGLHRGAEQVGLGRQLTRQKSGKPPKGDGLRGDGVDDLFGFGGIGIRQRPGQASIEQRLHIGRPSFCRFKAGWPLPGRALLLEAEHPAHHLELVQQVLPDLNIVVEFATHRLIPPFGSAQQVLQRRPVLKHDNRPEPQRRTADQAGRAVAQPGRAPLGRRQRQGDNGRQRRHPDQ